MRRQSRDSWLFVLARWKPQRRLAPAAIYLPLHRTYRGYLRGKCKYFHGWFYGSFWTTAGKTGVSCLRTLRCTAPGGCAWHWFTPPASSTSRGHGGLRVSVLGKLLCIRTGGVAIFPLCLAEKYLTSQYNSHIFNGPRGDWLRWTPCTVEFGFEGCFIHGVTIRLLQKRIGSGG